MLHLQDKVKLGKVEAKMAEIVKKLPENSTNKDTEDQQDMSLDLLIEVY